LVSLVARTRFARCLRAGRTIGIGAGIAIAHIVDDALKSRTSQRLTLFIVRHIRAVGHREAFDEGDGHSLLNRLDRNIHVSVMQDTVA
jgi:hypothetical protein